MEGPNLLSLLTNKGLPSIILFDEFRRVFTARTNLIKPSKNDHRPWISILPLGDLACDLQSEDRHIKCVALGNIRKELFVEISWERIMEAQTQDLTLRPYMVSEEQLVLELFGITFDMRYVECRELINKYPDVIDVPLTLQLQLPDGVNDIINELKDLERVRDCVNGGSVRGLIPFQHFPKLHQIVNNWTKASGLFGFGAFNQDAVRELSWKIVAEATSANITLTGDTSDTKLGLTRMLQTFFEMHNQCYEPSHIMLGGECSLGYQLNVTNNCSKTLHEELVRLPWILCCADADIVRRDILSPAVANHITQERVIRISVCYSSNSEVDGYVIMNSVDQLFLGLVVSLESAQDRLRGLHFRVWPTRLVEASNTFVSGPKEPYEGYWIIGLSGFLDRRKEVAIKQILAVWEQRICVAQKYPSSSFTIFAALLPRSEIDLEHLKVDTRQWQRPIVEPAPSFRLEARVQKQRPEIAIEDGSGQTPQLDMEMGPSKKLCPAMEVLNRLRWDYKFNVDDFNVVYRDRHGGMLEKPVKDWATDTTAADWIPQDRIWFFKRLSDGVMVWDRSNRKDLINQ